MRGTRAAAGAGSIARVCARGRIRGGARSPVGSRPRRRCPRAVRARRIGPVARRAHPQRHRRSDDDGVWRRSSATARAAPPRVDDAPGRAAVSRTRRRSTAAGANASSSQSAPVPMAQAGAGWRLEAWSGGRPRRAMTFPPGDWDGDPLTDDPDWLHAVQTCISLVNARAIHVENAAGLSLVSLSSLMGIGASQRIHGRAARSRRALGPRPLALLTPSHGSHARGRRTQPPSGDTRRSFPRSAR